MWISICPSWNYVIWIEFAIEITITDVALFYIKQFTCSQNFLNYLAFHPFDFERTWWKLFQKRIVRTKFDIYVFIPTKYNILLCKIILYTFFIIDISITDLYLFDDRNIWITKQTKEKKACITDRCLPTQSS